MERAQALLARDLERQHAPGMLEPAKLARRSAHLHALLDIELVEAERRDARRRQGHADMGPELLDRRQRRQRLRLVHEVVERHQRMGLAPAIGKLKLADGLGVLAGEAERHIAREFPQRKGRIGQSEEPAGVFIDRTRAFLDRHVVEVGGEVGKRELARAHVFAQFHDVVPGCPREGLRHVGLARRVQGTASIRRARTSKSSSWRAVVTVLRLIAPTASSLAFLTVGRAIRSALIAISPH